MTQSQSWLNQQMRREWLNIESKHFNNQMNYIPTLIFSCSSMEVNFFGWNLCLFNRMESSNPVHKTPTYIVYENCLLELFEVCPVCRRVTDVQTRRVGTFLSVEQKCPHCQFYRKWNSQPLLGSTPVGNIQLSAAVYATGASFFKLEKVIVNWLYLNSQHNSLVVINWTWNIIIWIFWSEIIYIYVFICIYTQSQKQY